MQLATLSSARDVAQLNNYLWDIRNAIVNWQVNGDHVIADTLSGTQIAPKSVAGSCLAETLRLDGDLIIPGFISAGEAVSAASGFYTEGNISAAGDVTAEDLWAERVIASTVISAYSTANLSVDNDAWIAGDLITDTLSATGNLTADTISADTGFDSDGYLVAGGTISATGNLTADAISATGNLTADNISATNTLQVSGIVHATSGWFANGWTGWFDDGTNFRTFVSAGIITGVENSVAGGHS